MVSTGETIFGEDQQRLWQEYCGFLDFSVTEFMDVQNYLLHEEIELVAESPLAQRIAGGAKPRTIEEFRTLVPLTTYDDYAPSIGDRQEDALAIKPYCWARTSGRGSTVKWVPFAKEAIDWLGKLGVAMIMLSSASRKGEVWVGNGVRFVHNVPPRPFLTGTGILAMLQQLQVRTIPPLEEYEKETFQKRIEDGFEIALRTGADILCSMTSILIRMGERFTDNSRQRRFSWQRLHPAVLFRLMRAFLVSRKEGRAVLPKDLWPLKGLICYGMDTGIYRDQIIHYWGRVPLEVYGSTEAGLMATQAWNKKWMVLFPFSCFFEFMPEEEWLKNRDDKDYQPATVLIDEVEVGKCYELIITSFYGMPFLRYRIGDLIRIECLRDEETGIQLPQISFVSRADDIIDIAGFTRLDEKTIWQAIVNTGVKYGDWTARKEYDADEPVVRIYIEPKGDISGDEVARLIHGQLRATDTNYMNLEDMLGIRPLRVTLVPEGSFRNFYEAKQRAGADLAGLKFPHMGASDSEIQELFRLSVANREGAS